MPALTLRSFVGAHEPASRAFSQDNVSACETLPSQSFLRVLLLCSVKPIMFLFFFFLNQWSNWTEKAKLFLECLNLETSPGSQDAACWYSLCCSSRGARRLWAALGLSFWPIICWAGTPCASFAAPFSQEARLSPWFSCFNKPTLSFLSWSVFEEL